jgi:hypothetical protein
MEADEDETLPGLRHAEVSGVENHRVDPVATPAGEVTLDLLQDAHLRHPWDVLHYEGLGFDAADKPNELSVQAVLRVVDEPAVVANLGKALTRWASGDDINLSTCCEQSFPDAPLP